MSIASTIRAAKNLDLAGAKPGTSAVVHRAAKTLEEEHALRLNLQREANAARRIIAQMEEDAAELRRDATVYEDAAPGLVLVVNQRAGSLERYAASLRRALSPEGAEEAGE